MWRTLRDILALCCAQVLCVVQLFTTPWTVAHQAPLSMGLPRQEYWSGLPFLSPEDLLEPVSPTFAGGFCIPEPAEKPSDGDTYRIHK